MEPDTPEDQWTGMGMVVPRQWVCGFCNNRVAGSRGFRRREGVAIYICSHCFKPTFFDGDTQMPGVAFGTDVANLPMHVAHAYTEARNCVAVCAFTAATMMARKILMAVAVELGAEKDLSYKVYVDYLVEKHHLGPRAKGWVDHVRIIGNDANHEIPQVSKKDAEDVLTFVEMLLKTTYEYPTRIVEQE